MICPPNAAPRLARRTASSRIKLRGTAFLLLLLGVMSQAQAQFTGCNNPGDQTEIPTLECEALVALYTSTDGLDWTNNTGWLATNTPCGWFGIACTDGSVSHISLNLNNVSGTIPPEIGNLNSLQNINLIANTLTGAIPPEIGNLNSLTHLFLTGNSLTGTLPPEIGNLNSLTHLHLSSNSLTGTLPPEIGDLTNLTYLRLNNNNLTGTVPLSVATVGANTSPCDLAVTSLCMPDTPAYQALAKAGILCGLSLDPTCPVVAFPMVSALLNGPHDAAYTMHAELGPLVPSAQPYYILPWNYTGSESFTTLPEGIVDWVLVSLRTGPGAASTIASRAGLLRQDGQVKDTDGTSALVFVGVDVGNYYVVVDHRNHLSVMTPAGLDFSLGQAAYDFGLGVAYGLNGMHEVEPGVYALWGGDGTADGSVTAFDFLNTWLPINGEPPGYYEGDFNMDGSGTAFDFLTVWLPANGQSSQVPN